MPDDLRAKLEALAPKKGVCRDCGFAPKVKGRHLCFWCLLSRDSADVQAEEARIRRATAPAESPRTRPKSEWPAGHRWCGSCFSFVPLSYCTGTMCKGCMISKRRERTYGLTTEDQAKLYRMSGGKCQICGSGQRGQALATDHDHKSGEVRGLLCGKGGVSCNEVIGWWFDDAKRFLATAVYLLDPPAQQKLSTSTIVDMIANLTREILNERNV